MKKVNDYQRMLDTATAFFLAAERCVPEFKFGVYQSHSVSAPVLCNYAMSVEIMLKLILKHHDVDPPKGWRGHDLLLLCRKIPQSNRSFLNYYLQPSPIDNQSIIREISRYFVDWRYSYEKEFLIGSHNEIRRLFIDCYREIRHLKPDLRNYYENDWGMFEPDWMWAWFEQEHKEIEKNRTAENNKETTIDV